jgi:hypothetical protein
VEQVSSDTERRKRKRKRKSLTELNYPNLHFNNYEGISLLYSSLLSYYAENAMTLVKTLDYWKCRELIDIASSGRINPEDKLQVAENTKFNKFLDDISYRKHEWEHLSDKFNLWQIKKRSENIFSNDDSNNE